MNKKALYGGIAGGIGCLGLLILIAACAGGWYYFSEQRKANERNAILGLQNIAKAQNEFFFTKLNLKYGTFDELNSAGQLNGYGHDLKNGSQGYSGRIDIKGPTWTAVAEPKSYGFFNGYRSFIISTDGKVHGREGAGATLSDPVVSTY